MIVGHMIRQILFSLACVSLLAGCGASRDLNALHERKAMEMVNADLKVRISALGVETPGYTVQAIGEPGAGSHGGNGVSLGLVPLNGGDPVSLPMLEYEYSFTLMKGDTDVAVEIVYRPSDDELRMAIEAMMRQLP